MHLLTLPLLAWFLLMLIMSALGIIKPEIFKKK